MVARRGCRSETITGAAGYPSDYETMRKSAFGPSRQPTVPTVGYLGSASSELSAKAVRAFRDGLSEVGYVEGRNVTIEYRWADGQNNRSPGLAADLVRPGGDIRLDRHTLPMTPKLSQ